MASRRAMIQARVVSRAAPNQHGDHRHASVDPSTGNNSDSAAPAGADLALTKSIDNAKPNVTTSSFTIGLHNAGRIRPPMSYQRSSPAGLAFRTHSFQGPTPAASDYRHGYSWEFQTLIMARSSALHQTSTATVAIGPVRPDTANNSVCHRNASAADLAITKTGARPLQRWRHVASSSLSNKGPDTRKPILRASCRCRRAL